MATQNLKQISHNLTGKVLVATHQLKGSIFEQGLIFVCAHDEHGAIGIMFNKPMKNEDSYEILQKYTIFKKIVLKKKLPILKGGPIDDKKVVVLSISNIKAKNVKENTQLIMYNKVEDFLKDLADDKSKDKFIICQGFCGWGAGQLEDEVAENSWITIEANFKTIFSKKLEQKWHQIIKKMGIKNFDKLVSYTGNA